jgi:hypothetical protein
MKENTPDIETHQVNRVHDRVNVLTIFDSKYKRLWEP